MRVILVRVGIDQAYGHWNGPIDPETHEFVYVPIPETREPRLDLATPYTIVTSSLARFARGRITDAKACALPAALTERYMHLDPDFLRLTYGNNPNTRGDIVNRLVADDVMVFYAGLRPCRPGGAKHAGNLIYAIIGFYRVAEVVRLAAVEEARWGENAHTRRSAPNPDDVIIRAVAGSSGRLRRCLPFGDWRDRAYRVFPELLTEWGHLSCNDGYLQRSAIPPTFNDAARFLAWFEAQRPELIQENN